MSKRSAGVYHFQVELVRRSLAPGRELGDNNALCIFSLSMHGLSLQMCSILVPREIQGPALSFCVPFGDSKLGLGSFFGRFGALP
jgi:hypothetical protein